MRRAVWLATGAVLGVVGYRRIDRAARSFAGQFTALPAGRHAVGSRGAVAPAKPGSAARLAANAAGWLSRRARDGHLGGRGHAGAAAFVSDVRAGIEEYLDARGANIDRQYVPAGNTLVDQRTAGNETKDGR
jgi:hypothetical protein